MKKSGSKPSSNAMSISQVRKATGLKSTAAPRSTKSSKECPTSKPSSPSGKPRSKKQAGTGNGNKSNMNMGLLLSLANAFLPALSKVASGTRDPVLKTQDEPSLPHEKLLPRFHEKDGKELPTSEGALAGWKYYKDVMGIDGVSGYSQASTQAAPPPSSSPGLPPCSESTSSSSASSCVENFNKLQWPLRQYAMQGFLDYISRMLGGGNGLASWERSLLLSILNSADPSGNWSASVSGQTPWAGTPSFPSPSTGVGECPDPLAERS